jgi:hypothetical protein
VCSSDLSSAAQIARLMFQASVGIGRGAANEAQLDQTLTSFIRTYLIGARVVRLRAAKSKNAQKEGDAP